MSVADEIRKLNELREQGIISDAEFEQQKRLLLAPNEPTAPATAPIIGPLPHQPSQALAWSDVDLKNKWWFQWLLSILITPVGLALVVFFKSYRKVKDNEVKRVGVGFKIFFVGLVLFLWLVAFASMQGGTSYVPIESPAEQTASESLPSCESADARALVDDAITNNVASNISTLRLLDMTEVQEVSSTESERRCNATLFLNSGSERVGYRIFPSSDHSMLLVEVGQPYAPTVPSVAPLAPAPTNDKRSNVDYDLARERALTPDEIAIAETVCAIPDDQRLDQLSIAELSYSSFCLDAAR